MQTPGSSERRIHQLKSTHGLVHGSWNIYSRGRHCLYLVGDYTTVVFLNFFSYFFGFLNFFLSRQSFFVYPWMSWNSLYRPDWPWTQMSACLCLPVAGIKGMHHHHPAFQVILKWLFYWLFSLFSFQMFSPFQVPPSWNSLLHPLFPASVRFLLINNCWMYVYVYLI